MNMKGIIAGLLTAGLVSSVYAADAQTTTQAQAQPAMPEMASNSAAPAKNAADPQQIMGKSATGDAQTAMMDQNGQWQASAPNAAQVTGPNTAMNASTGAMGDDSAAAGLMPDDSMKQ